MKIKIELTHIETLLTLSALSKYINNPDNETDKKVAETVYDKIYEFARISFEEQREVNNG